MLFIKISKHALDLLYLLKSSVQDWRFYLLCFVFICGQISEKGLVMHMHVISDWKPHLLKIFASVLVNIVKCLSVINNTLNV